MKKYGRVTLCGSIENYNDKEPKLCESLAADLCSKAGSITETVFYFQDPSTNYHILSKELRVQGIIVSTFKAEWPLAFVEMKKYIDEVRP